MTTGKIIALTIQTFVNKVMSLLFNMSRFVIALEWMIPRESCLLLPPRVTSGPQFYLPQSGKNRILFHGITVKIK